jgi:hypothetical protein
MSTGDITIDVLSSNFFLENFLEFLSYPKMAS